MPQDEFQSPRALGRFILREALFGSLATEGEGGYPYVSLVGVAAMASGAPVMLLSNLARHTINIRKDPRVSLLLTEKPNAPDPLVTARLTVTGKVAPVEKSEIRARYLIRHPEAAKYVNFADFGFWGLAIQHGHLVATFGKIFDLTAEELLGTGGLSWPKG
ncbi:MAG: pyridoxamine 5'-phosphate oxidase family protein [Xanthobacteraceae bacterium]|jgi:putative heme iron utilization protein|nr:pyridoxamine 5'-phosphate oxidase family protein [Xanthobacteraceae bacterium]